MFKIFGITFDINVSVRRKPIRGDQRQVRVFAVLPTRIDARTVVWLSHYYEDQVYRSGCGVEGGDYWYTQCQYLVKPAVGSTPL